MVLRHFQAFKRRVLARDPRAVVELNNVDVGGLRVQFGKPCQLVADLSVITGGKKHEYSLTRINETGKFHTTRIIRQ